MPLLPDMDVVEITRLKDSKPRYVLRCPADPVPSAESGSITGLPLPQPGHEASLTLLIAALVEQTEAINRLASSNEALVQAMAQSEGMDEDAQPGAYLSGAPVR